MLGAEVRIERELVRLKISGRRADSFRQGPSWTDAIREASEREKKPVLLLCTLEAGVEIPISLVAAGARQTVPVVPLLRAVAVVVPGERERAMIRAAVMAVGASYPVELFECEDEALLWLSELRQDQDSLPAARALALGIA